MDDAGLLKQAIAEKGKANLSFSGKSMYPTLKDSMVVTISHVFPQEVKVSDIITYQDSNLIVAHRVIDIFRDKNEIVFITKGDNQPFGGVSRVNEKDFIGKIKGAFYSASEETNILNEKIFYRLLFVFFGRLYLFYRKFIRKYLPLSLRLFLKMFIGNLYFSFRGLLLEK